MTAELSVFPALTRQADAPLPADTGFLAQMLAQARENDARRRQQQDRQSALYSKQLKAKLKRDAQAFSEFRKLDTELHEQRHRARMESRLSLAQADESTCREYVTELEPGALAARAALREAEDRALKAAEYARECAEQYERVKLSGTPQDATEAFQRAGAAREVARSAREAEESASMALREAETGLSEARSDLAEAVTELDAAKAAADVPAGEAPLSDITITACAAYLQSDEMWAALTDSDRIRVRNAMKPRDMLSTSELLARI